MGAPWAPACVASINAPVEAPNGRTQIRDTGSSLTRGAVQELSPSLAGPLAPRVTPTGPWTPEVAPLLWGPWAGPVTPRASQVPAWPLMTRRKARPQVMPQGEDGPRVSSRTCSLGSTLQPRGHTECHNACSTDAVTALPVPGPVSSACLVQSFTSGFFHSDVNT